MNKNKNKKRQAQRALFSALFALKQNAASRNPVCVLNRLLVFVTVYSAVSIEFEYNSLRELSTRRVCV